MKPTKQRGSRERHTKSTLTRILLRGVKYQKVRVLLESERFILLVLAIFVKAKVRLVEAFESEVCHGARTQQRHVEPAVLTLLKRELKVDDFIVFVDGFGHLRGCIARVELKGLAFFFAQNLHDHTGAIDFASPAVCDQVEGLALGPADFVAAEWVFALFVHVVPDVHHALVCGAAP